MKCDAYRIAACTSHLRNSCTVDGLLLAAGSYLHMSFSNGDRVYVLLYERNTLWYSPKSTEWQLTQKMVHINNKYKRDFGNNLRSKSLLQIVVVGLSSGSWFTSWGNGNWPKKASRRDVHLLCEIPVNLAVNSEKIRSAGHYKKRGSTPLSSSLSCQQVSRLYSCPSTGCRRNKQNEPLSAISKFCLLSWLWILITRADRTMLRRAGARSFRQKEEEVKFFITFLWFICLRTPRRRLFNNYRYGTSLIW